MHSIREYPCVLIESDDTYANNVRKITSVMISFACLFARGRLMQSICERKGVSLPVEVLYWNEIFKMFISRICWLYFTNSLNTVCWSGAFLYVTNRFPSLLYLLVDVRSCDRSCLENSDLETSDLENSDLETSDPLKNDWNCKRSSTWMYIFLHDNYYRD